MQLQLHTVQFGWQIGVQSHYNRKVLSGECIASLLVRYSFWGKKGDQNQQLRPEQFAWFQSCKHTKNFGRIFRFSFFVFLTLFGLRHLSECHSRMQASWQNNLKWGANFWGVKSVFSGNFFSRFDCSVKPKITVTKNTHKSELEMNSTVFRIGERRLIETFLLANEKLVKISHNCLCDSQESQKILMIPIISRLQGRVFHAFAGGAKQLSARDFTKWAVALDVYIFFWKWKKPERIESVLSWTGQA